MASYIYVSAEFSGEDIGLVDTAFRDFINNFPEDTDIEITEFRVKKFVEEEAVAS